MEQEQTNHQGSEQDGGQKCQWGSQGWNQAATSVWWYDFIIKFFIYCTFKNNMGWNQQKLVQSTAGPDFLLTGYLTPFQEPCLVFSLFFYLYTTPINKHLLIQQTHYSYNSPKHRSPNVEMTSHIYLITRSRMCGAALLPPICLHSTLLNSAYTQLYCTLFQHIFRVLTVSEH